MKELPDFPSEVAIDERKKGLPCSREIPSLKHWKPCVFSYNHKQ